MFLISACLSYRVGHMGKFYDRNCARTHTHTHTHTHTPAHTQALAGHSVRYDFFFFFLKKGHVGNAVFTFESMLHVFVNVTVKWKLLTSIGANS